MAPERWKNKQPEAPAALCCTSTSPHVQQSATNRVKGPRFDTFYTLTHWQHTYILNVQLNTLMDPPCVWMGTTTRAEANIWLGLQSLTLTVLFHRVEFSFPFWKDDKVLEDPLIADQLINKLAMLILWIFWTFRLNTVTTVKMAMAPRRSGGAVLCAVQGIADTLKG